MNFSNKLLNLKWEKTSEEKTGVLIPQKRIFNPFILKRIAMSKMTSISLITGDFNGSSVSFSPLFWVLMDASSSIDFIGVYAADTLELDLDSENIIIDDDRHSSLPLVCIRKATWNQAEDLENFKLASDKNQYIISDTQMNCNASFLGESEGKPMLYSLMKIINFWKHGVKLEKSTNKEPVHEEVKINISESCFSLMFSYNPYLVNNKTWDELLEKWCQYFNELSVNDNYIPDENFRVSYQLSLLEQIGIFMT